MQLVVIIIMKEVDKIATPEQFVTSIKMFYAA